ncbi:hypothetical protein NVP1135O_61 [Vibrio phage 1.135.O._10N.222.54.B6]|nr:hypothetical protein NVP1135O_61 [Vibrio phage 1.135.O._10N.222.54.B6]
MEIELRRSTFGFSYDCKLNVENKMDGVHIEILEAEYPSLINENVICHLVNQHRGEYDESVHTMRAYNKCANSGFLAKEIAYLEERLEKARFAQKLAKRKKVLVFDRTEA